MEVNGHSTSSSGSVGSSDHTNLGNKEEGGVKEDVQIRSLVTLHVELPITPSGSREWRWCWEAQ